MRGRTAASVPAPPTATSVATVMRGAACATQATLAPPAPPAPARPTAGAEGAVCRDRACVMQATVVRTVDRKSLLPAPALRAAGPGNCAVQANAFALRASEARTAPSRHAPRTAVAEESVVRAVASAKRATQERTVEKVSGQPSPLYCVRDWQSKPVGRRDSEALEPRELEEEWKEALYGGSHRSQGASLHQGQQSHGAIPFRYLMSRLRAPWLLLGRCCVPGREGC